MPRDNSPGSVPRGIDGVPCGRRNRDARSRCRLKYLSSTFTYYYAQASAFTMRPSLHFILISTVIIVNAKPFGQRPANPVLTKRASGVSWNAADANGQTFDYIVVGGGLSGLTVSSRLAETGQSVLVVEAGRDDRWNPIVQDVFKYVRLCFLSFVGNVTHYLQGDFFGSDLNWQWPAEDGRTIAAWVSLYPRMLQSLIQFNCSAVRLLEVVRPSTEQPGLVASTHNTMPSAICSSPQRQTSSGIGKTCLGT